MNKIVITVFAIICLQTGGNALKCVNQTVVRHNGQEQRLYPKSVLECPPNANVCVRVLADVGEVETRTQSCSNDILGCDAVCNVIKALGGGLIDSCEAHCCDTDLCNTASLLAVSWKMMFLVFAAIILCYIY